MLLIIYSTLPREGWYPVTRCANTSLAWFIIRTFWASVPDTLDRSAVCTRPPKQGRSHAPRDELLALAAASRALGGLAWEDCHLWRFVTLALAPREHGLALVLWCERQCVRGGGYRLRWGNILCSIILSASVAV